MFEYDMSYQERYQYILDYIGLGKCNIVLHKITINIKLCYAI